MQQKHACNRVEIQKSKSSSLRAKRFLHVESAIPDAFSSASALQRVAIIPGARKNSLLLLLPLMKKRHTGSHAPLCHHVIMYPF